MRPNRRYRHDPTALASIRVNLGHIIGAKLVKMPDTETGEIQMGVFLPIDCNGVIMKKGNVFLCMDAIQCFNKINTHVLRPSLYRQGEAAVEKGYGVINQYGTVSLPICGKAYCHGEYTTDDMEMILKARQKHIEDAKQLHIQKDYRNSMQTR